mmetsp:Transcript_11917/g.19397  ORF Transcript_11917/g.19397 Transcript_11917/m.19397 type:complete len:195 (+) Transcript_11917:193-777(+)
MPQEKFVKKEFNNGHKTFVTSEAKAFNEQLKAEKSRREHFDAYKHTMIRDRNPLIGDPTPRVDLMTGVRINQEPIINPEWIPRPLPEFVTKKEKMTEKIGVETSKYHFLGNSYMIKEGSQQASSGDFRPLSSAGAAVISPQSSRPATSLSQKSGGDQSSRQPLASARSTGSRPGSDWKTRMTDDGTLRPMIRFF